MPTQGVAPVKRRAGRPTRGEAVHLSNEILRVAEDHLMKKGYEGTVIERVAAEVGTTKGAIYNRFGSKAQLLARVGDRLLKRHYEPFDMDIRGHKSLLESLREHAMALIAAGTDTEAISHYRIMLAASQENPEIVEMLGEHARFYEKETVRFFEYLIARGEIHLRNRERTASLFSTLILGKINEALARGVPIPELPETERYVTWIILIFLGGIGRLELDASEPSCS